LSCRIIPSQVVHVKPEDPAQDYDSLFLLPLLLRLRKPAADREGHQAVNRNSAIGEVGEGPGVQVLEGRVQRQFVVQAGGGGEEAAGDALAGRERGEFKETAGDAAPAGVARGDQDAAGGSGGPEEADRAGVSRVVEDEEPAVEPREFALGGLGGGGDVADRRPRIWRGEPGLSASFARPRFRPSRSARSTAASSCHLADREVVLVTVAVRHNLGQTPIGWQAGARGFGAAGTLSCKLRRVGLWSAGATIR
jgi:hypothetical protein